MTDSHHPEKPDEIANTGSLADGEPVFLVIGVLGRPHGVRGEIQLNILTDFPERIVAGKTLFLGDEYRPLRISSVRGHGDKYLLAFKEYSDRDAVGLLRNQTVFVKAAEIPELPEGEYYHHELLGLAVWSDAGEKLGLVTDILETGANEVFVVLREDGKELLLPSIDDVILEIDPAQGRITVHLLPGLI